ncbi:hypothetical protein ACFQ2B_31110 [Streptomyces stramineus]
MIKKIDGLNEPLKVPNFFTETISAVTGFLSDLRRVRELLQREPGRYPPAAQRVLDSARTLVDTIAAFLAQELARRPQDPPGPRTIEEIDRAFDAFATALTTLLDTLPPDADPGVRTLLVRAQEQVATWTSAAGRALSLRDAVLAAARGRNSPRPSTRGWSGTPRSSPGHRPPPPRSSGPTRPADGSPRRRPARITAPRSDRRRRYHLHPRRVHPRPRAPVMEAMELTFQRVRFTARAGKKLDVEIVFRGIKFIGPLAFVDTLRKLIPIDGFSDPPGLRVTPSGIVATYALPLPNLAIGVFSLENLRLAASLDLPFVGKPLEASFSFCTRQAPFRLTVSMLGGGGFFGIVITPERVAVLEAALEFGAALSMNLGVASGSLSVMAGIYFRLELATGTARLTGYFRARGEVDVLGIVSASIEIYLALEFETAGGTVYGRARITISIHIGFWSQSVTIECEKRFIGSGPPPPPCRAGPPPRPRTPPGPHLRRDDGALPRPGERHPARPRRRVLHRLRGSELNHARDDPVDRTARRSDRRRQAPADRTGHPETHRRHGPQRLPRLPPVAPHPADRVPARTPGGLPRPRRRRRHRPHHRAARPLPTARQRPVARPLPAADQGGRPHVRHRRLPRPGHPAHPALLPRPGGAPAGRRPVRDRRDHHRPQPRVPRRRIGGHAAGRRIRHSARRRTGPHLGPPRRLRPPGAPHRAHQETRQNSLRQLPPRRRAARRPRRQRPRRRAPDPYRPRFMDRTRPDYLSRAGMLNFAELYRFYDRTPPPTTPAPPTRNPHRPHRSARTSTSTTPAPSSPTTRNCCAASGWPPTSSSPRRPASPTSGRPAWCSPRTRATSTSTRACAPGRNCATPPGHAASRTRPTTASTGGGCSAWAAATSS